MVTLRIGFAVVLAGGGAVLSRGDAVPDGDFLRADEDVLDEQPEVSRSAFRSATDGAVRASRVN